MRAEFAEVVEAALAERAPEALHFPAGGRVVGLGVQERDAQALAAEAQRVAAIGGAVVQIQRIGGAVATESADQKLQHVGFLFCGAGFQRHDVARGVVE